MVVGAIDAMIDEVGLAAMACSVVVMMIRSLNETVYGIKRLDPAAGDELSPEKSSSVPTGRELARPAGETPAAQYKLVKDEFSSVLTWAETEPIVQQQLWGTREREHH